MSDIIQTLATLTFAYADREAKWLNRYNRLQPNPSLELEWCYKEGFYQTRFIELLRLIPDEQLERMESIIRNRLDALPGASMPQLSAEQLKQFTQTTQP